MIKFLYRKSRWLHKILGLFLVLFFMWMSVSGIVLNHPEVVANLSVPHWLIPPAYKIKNWNRSSLIGLVYDKQDPATFYVYGKKGVWKTLDSGKTFVPMQKGFPESRYYLKTNHLFFWEGDHPFLLAATDGGLYQAFLKDEIWHKVTLPFEHEAIKKILLAQNKLLVFSESHVFQTVFPAEDLQFTTVPIRRAVKQDRVTLVKLFFDLHDGRVFGLPGRLLMDLVGLILFFMSFSGFYIWFNPWRWRRKRQKSIQMIGRSKIKFVRSLVHDHLTVGIYVALFFLILGGTAFFMRPPFLAFIADGSVPKHYYPGKLSDNPWEKKIQNALYDAKRRQLIIAADDGIWQGSAQFDQPFKKVHYHVPIFVMGPTVFECRNGQYLIGSFNGLFRYDPDKDSATNVMSGKTVTTFSNIRPGQWMVTGYFTLPSGETYITTHDRGIIALNQEMKGDYFPVPATMNRNFTLSLWNYMFELHNGRIFQDLIGNLYLLIPPLGAFIFVIITLTGIFDWFYIKLRHLKIADINRKNYIENNAFEFKIRSKEK